MIRKHELVTLIEMMRATLLEDDDSIREVLSSVADSPAIVKAFRAANNPISEDSTNPSDDVLDKDMGSNIIGGYFG